MSLNDWLDKGWLVKHRSDRREIRELLGIADRDITDSQASRLSVQSEVTLFSEEPWKTF